MCDRSLAAERIAASPRARDDGAHLDESLRLSARERTKDDGSDRRRDAR